MIYYVYLLKITSNDKKYYIGSTSNIKNRIFKHKNGKCLFTKKYLPIKLIYFECFNDKKIALQREKQLKRFSSAYIALLKRLKLK